MNQPLVRGRVMAEAEPIIEGLPEIESKLLEEVRVEVATPEIKAGVPLVVVKYARLPAVAFDEVPTLLLKVDQLAEVKQPKTEPEAMSQVVFPAE